jgi:hypothetical protein
MNVRDLLVVATAVSVAGCGAIDDERVTPQSAGSAPVQMAAPPLVPYLGQPVPGLTPERFAAGVVSTDAIELNAVFSPDGREFYFTRVVEGLDTMHQMTFVDGKWGEARQLMLFPDRVRVESADMVLSSDGQELYFLASYDRAGTGPTPNYDLWVSRRVGGAWTTAELVGPPISTAANEYYPALDADGSLYFVSDRGGRTGRLYKAQRRADGGFDAPVPFGPSTVGLDAGDTALAPDQSYLIMTPSPQGSSGRGDLHVSFRRADGSWSDLIRLDDAINTSDHEWCPMVTPDGRYVFFSRRRGPAGPPWAATTIADVFWMDARVLERYRPSVGASDQ